MAERNYYEPPRSPSAPNDLGGVFASHLLEARDKGFTLGLYYRWQVKGYLALAFLFGMVIVYFSWLRVESAATSMIGILIGILLRDFGIARAQVKIWKIQSKLMDWDKVQRLADGELLDV